MATNRKFKELIHRHRTHFLAHKTRPYSFRLNQLKNLLKLYEENNDLILSSLKNDMNKSKLEAYLYEVDFMKNDVRMAIKYLKNWMKETKLKMNLLMPMDDAGIVGEPEGVVLILSPWNYPFQLTLIPLCAAIASGNCVVIKPSEISPHSSKTIATLIPRYLDTDCYSVVEGGPDVVGALLEEKFDHIFYTGSFTVAREIHRMANKYLTKCTFELGGKSPVYLDSTVDVTMAAKRIMWGKCINVGQTCVAPDYVICTKSMETKFLTAAKLAMDEWYGPDWKKAEDLARIVNLRHFHRVKDLLLSGGEVGLGGKWDEEELWIEPSVVVNVKETDKIMTDEIFGPLLAIYNVESEDEAIEFINSRPSKPLCLYVFSASKATMKRFRDETQSGTMAFNDTIVQFAVDELPFGGIGESGHGYYHGKFGFDEFTHFKGIVYRDYSWIGDQVGIFRYPPYSALKIKILSFLLCHWKKFKFIYFDYFGEIFLFLAGFFVAWWVFQL